MQPVTSTRLSSASSSRDLHGDATCTTHRRTSANFGANWETLAWLASRRSNPLEFNTCPAPFSSHWFCGATDKLSPGWFWGPNQESVTMILRPKSPNHSCRFGGPIRETRRPWFWGQTKKPELLVSLSTVQTAHGVSWPPDHPVTEYPTDAWPSAVLYTRSSTPA
jgi:hypothetical protein